MKHFLTNVAATLLTLAVVLAQPAAMSAAQEVSIKGRNFFKDGKPWLLKGIKVEGFNRPVSEALSSSMNASAKEARSWWGNAELDAIRNVFRADTVRFAVSQPGLDPQSPIYAPAYRNELLAAIRLARSRGFVVIVSMDAQAENGVADLPCMPNDSTTRAWDALAPALKGDKGVMLELFDEPCRGNWAKAREEWAQEMQSLVDDLRSSGSTNILLLDGLGFAQSTNELFPLVHDKLPNRMAMAVHPYVNSLKGVNLDDLEGYFRSRFGATASKHPILATEWNATPTNGCVGEATPKVALALVRYLQAQRIGLIGWAIDSTHGKLVKDHVNFEPTDYQEFAGCSKAPGISGGGKLIANFPNN